MFSFRKLAIAIFVTVSFGDPAQSVTGLTDEIATENESGTSILMYHRFRPNISNFTTVTNDNFENQILWLKNNNFNFIKLTDVVEAIKAGRDLPKKSVVFTVDDGHYTQYRFMFPLILKHQVPVTLFIYTDAISNTQNDQAISWDQLREMENSGLVDIQSHSLSHPDFNEKRTTLSPDTFEKFALNELVKSKQILEEKLNKEIKIFAWPYGSFNQTVQDLAKQAGYEAAVGTASLQVSSRSNLFSLPRFHIYNDTVDERLASFVFQNSKQKNVSVVTNAKSKGEQERIKTPDQLKSDIAMLRREKEALIKRNQILDERLGVEELQVLKQIVELDSIKLILGRIESENAKKTDDIIDLVSERDSLKDKLNELSVDRDRIFKNMKDMTDQIDRQQHELSTLAVTIDQKTRDIANLNEVIQLQKSTLNQSEKAKEVLQVDLASAQATVTKLNDDMTKLISVSNNLSESNRNLMQNSIEQSQELKNLETKIRDSVSDRETLIIKLNQLNSEKMDLQAKLKLMEEKFLIDQNKIIGFQGETDKNFNSPP